MGIFFGPVAVGLYRLADRVVEVVLDLTCSPSASCRSRLPVTPAERSGGPSRDDLQVPARDGVDRGARVAARAGYERPAGRPARQRVGGRCSPAPATRPRRHRQGGGAVHRPRPLRRLQAAFPRRDALADRRPQHRVAVAVGDALRGDSVKTHRCSGCPPRGLFFSSAIVLLPVYRRDHPPLHEGYPCESSYAACQGPPSRASRRWRSCSHWRSGAIDPGFPVAGAHRSREAQLW